MKKLLLAACLMAGLAQFSGVADAATVVNLDHSSAYTKAGTPQTNDYTMFKSETKSQPAQRINVGYLVTGDESMLLDDETMGYIRRMLNTKFPGGYYPTNRLENTYNYLQVGRRNNGEQYNLKEAKDVQSREYEILENKISVIPKTEIITINKGEVDYPVDTISPGDYYYGNSVKIESVDPLGMDNTYRYKGHLATLSKDEYVNIARSLKMQGKSNYDYLILFNIHLVNQQSRQKAFLGIASSRWTDYSISVKAIDVNSGEYIDRSEYLKRGYSGGSIFRSPSWRRGMRRAIVDGLIECFDNIPIGKYSICDSDYCARRQRERREEEVFGKVNRHCVQHCNDVDASSCYYHMVDYAKDADLPSKYVDHNHNHID